MPRVAPAARRSTAHPRSLVVLGSRLHLGLRPHPVGERRERGHRTAAEDERVVQVLLERAQVDRVVVLVGDDEAEHVDVERARRREVGHDELRVRAADDVGAG